MRELLDRAKCLEVRLTDLQLLDVRDALVAARKLLEDKFATIALRRDEDNERDPLATYSDALMGAVAMAEAVVDQFRPKARPEAIDGDVHLGPYSWAPGSSCAALRAALLQAEIDATKQRAAILEPLTRAAIAQELAAS